MRELAQFILKQANTDPRIITRPIPPQVDLPPLSEVQRRSMGLPTNPAPRPAPMPAPNIPISVTPKAPTPPPNIPISVKPRPPVAQMVSPPPAAQQDVVNRGIMQSLGDAATRVRGWHPAAKAGLAAGTALTAYGLGRGIYDVANALPGAPEPQQDPRYHYYQ